MNNLILNSIYNAPMKRCIITKVHYPIYFMLRFVRIKDTEGKEIFIPDSLYSNVRRVISH